MIYTEVHAAKHRKLYKEAILHLQNFINRDKHWAYDFRFYDLLYYKFVGKAISALIRQDISKKNQQYQPIRIKLPYSEADFNKEDITGAFLYYSNLLSTNEVTVFEDFDFIPLQKTSDKFSVKTWVKLANCYVNRLFKERKTISFDFKKWEVYTDHDLAFYYLNLPRINTQSISFNLDKRKQLFDSVSEADKEVKRLMRLLSAFIPLELFEGLAKKHNPVKSIARIKSASLIVTETYSKIEERLFCGICLQNQGTGLVTLQHGGAYGQVGHSYYLETESDVSTSFFSWGQKLSPNTDSVGSLHLYQLRKNYLADKTEKKDKVILMCAIYTPDRNLSASGIHWAREEQRVEFSTLIKSKVAERLIIRPRAGRGEDVALQLTGFHKEFPNDPKSPILDLYKKAYLVVIEYHFSTSFFETVYLDIPTLVMVRDIKIMTCIGNQNLIEVFETLASAGVISEDAVYVSEMVNKSKEEIASWWESDPVKNAVSLFKETCIRELDMDHIRRQLKSYIS